MLDEAAASSSTVLVTVTALCPGITATAMFDRAAQDNPRVAQLPGILVGDVQEVAAEGYRA